MRLRVERPTPRIGWQRGQHHAESSRIGCLERLEPRLLLDSTTVINEVMYAPIDGSPEWIELHNQQAVDMDLSGWSLTNGIDYQFPKGTVIQGRGYLVVSAAPDRHSELDAFGPFQGRLSNGGERIELRDVNGRLMSELNYRDDGVWPVAADGSGASLAKADEGRATDLAANWRASARVGGTPGAENFPEVAKARRSLVRFDSEWRFDDTGVAPGNDWHNVSFQDTEWSVGRGLFWDAVESLPVEGMTELSPGQDSYYFRTKFDYDPGNRTAAELLVSPYIEDGAVIYLNGTEVLRSNLPDGPISFSTPAVTELELAGLPEPIPLPIELLRNGENTIAVEVHQASTVFDVEIANGSFEADSNDPLFAPTGWEGSGFVFNGFSRVTQLDTIVNPRTQVPHPDGAQAIVLRSDDGEVMEIYQNLGLISAGTYQLDYAIADRLASQWLNYRVEVLAVDQDSETILYAADSVNDLSLRPVNGSSSHPHSETLLGQQGDWRDVQLHAQATAEHVGKTLQIKFKTDAQSAGDEGEHFEFALDNVRMSVDLDLVPDIVFGAELDVVEILPVPPNLHFTEIAGAASPSFFVEMANRGATPIQLGEVEITLDGATPGRVLLPPTELGAGQLITLDADALGFTVAEGDRLFMQDATGNVLDGRRVDRVAQGLHPTSGEWLVVSSPSPNGENQFALRNEVVINEIMYHGTPEFAKPSVPAKFETSSILSFDSPWRYFQSSVGLAAGWQDTRHPIGGDWQEGTGVLGFLPPNQTSPVPIGTQLSGPIEAGVRTYYFETEFTLSENELASLDQIEMRHLVDDGAVVYVNGIEVLRHQMPAGAITASTFASSGVGNAPISEPIVLPAEVLTAGSNRISVEVHQVSSFSNDVLFGLEVTGRRMVEPPIPGEPFRESELEWIELFNQSDDVVDLTGWRLDEAIRYEFPAGTMLGPGRYVVVASDVTAISAEYPELTTVIGEFDGRLSNRGETILLLDDVGNPADSVSYFDGGEWDDRADGAGPSLELMILAPTTRMASFGWRAMNRLDPRGKRIRIAEYPNERYLANRQSGMSSPSDFWTGQGKR